MSPEMVDALTRLVQLVGFPIAVAGYVLIRIEPRLREIRDAVRDLVQLTGGSRAIDRRRPDTPL